MGISAAILVIAYLAYKQSQSGNQAQVPANGYGIPDYGTSTGGSSNGGFFGGYSPYQPISPYTPTYTPTSAGTTATYTPPTYQTAAPALPFSLALAGTSSYGYTAPVAPSNPISVVIGSIQNPLAAAQLAHRGTSDTSYTSSLPAIQNPTATQTFQHRGTTPRQTITVPHVNTYARFS